MSVAELFAGLLPAVLELRREAALAVRGKIGFRLAGEGGGDWTVSLDEAAVRRGLEGDAGAVVEMSADDFRRLLRGAADAKLLARVGVRGDPSLVLVLGAILRPGTEGR